MEKVKLMRKNVKWFSNERDLLTLGLVLSLVAELLGLDKELS